MKSLILIISLFTALIAHAQQETQDFIKRLDIIKEYKTTIEDKEKNFDLLINKMKNYDHSNMIPRDKNLIQEAINELKIQKKKIQDSSASLFTNSTEKKIKLLDEKYLFKNTFEAKQKRLKKIQSKTGMSKRFKKFIEYTLDNKYVKADIAKASLFKEEKKLALEFNELNTFLIREENMYAANEIDIIKQTKAIEKTLSYPENAINEINQSMQVKEFNNNQFKVIKADHKKIQFDVTVGEYESGLFNCKEGNEPQIKRYKEFPNLVALTTNGKVKSILNISSNAPNTKDFIYKCSNFSQLGFCIDNSKKEICKIQEACSTALNEMEDLFNLDTEFKQNKAKMLNHLSQKRKDMLKAGKGIDILDEFNKEGRLGNISRDKYHTMFNEMIDYAKKTNFSSASDYTKKMKKVIESQRGKLLKQYSNDKNTIASLDYFHNDMLGFFEDAIEVDDLQEFVGNNCTNGDFCNKYKAWDKATSIFDAMEEVENLTQEQCPRIVLRFAKSGKQIQSSYICGKEIMSLDLKKFNNLNQDSKEIIDNFK